MYCYYTEHIYCNFCLSLRMLSYYTLHIHQRLNYWSCSYFCFYMLRNLKHALQSHHSLYSKAIYVLVNKLQICTLQCIPFFFSYLAQPFLISKDIMVSNGLKKINRMENITDYASSLTERDLWRKERRRICRVERECNTQTHTYTHAGVSHILIKEALWRKSG